MENKKIYSLVVAILNRGFADIAMSAARNAGAKGGTVIHSRDVGNEDVSKLWGLTAHETEIVLIIADAEDRNILFAGKIVNL